jgi:hypothetical protein
VGLSSSQYPPSGASFVALARYNADGSLDAGFGKSGIVVNSFNAGLEFATGVALQADGSIVLASESATGEALERYLAGPAPGSATLTVTGATLTAGGLQIFGGVVATFTDSDPSAQPTNFTATIAWGDNQTSRGDVAADGMGGFVVNGLHDYPSVGGRFATVITITPTGGAAATGTGLAHVPEGFGPPDLLASVAQQLVESAEYYGGFITAAYQKYLGRMPDAFGLNSWLTQMQHGLTDELQRNHLLGQPLHQPSG